MRFLELFSRSKSPPRGPSFPRVTADDTHVVCEVSAERRDVIAWRDLAEVRIVTTSAGPFAEDVFFVLVARSGGIVVPHAKVDTILPRLQQLPGFDHGRMIEAMGSTSDASFTVWRVASQE
jgi:hypothetical protein